MRFIILLVCLLVVGPIGGIGMFISENVACGGMVTFFLGFHFSNKKSNLRELFQRAFLSILSGLAFLALSIGEVFILRYLGMDIRISMSISEILQLISLVAFMFAGYMSGRNLSE